MKKSFDNPRGIILCLILCAFWRPLAQAQETASENALEKSQASFSLAIPFSEVESLERQMKNGKPKDFNDAAKKLIKLAQDRTQNDDIRTGIRIAHNLFLSSAPPNVRQQAFAILFRHAPVLLKRHTHEIRVRVPNVSCYGRFQDSLKEHICQQHEWVYTVTAIDTMVVQEGSTVPTIGTVAELIFVVDKNKRPRDLVAALDASQQYQMDRWTVLVEQPVRDLLGADVPQGEAEESKD